jgi:predicted enzyme related to lactoylglutathione lyase
VHVFAEAPRRVVSAAARVTKAVPLFYVGVPNVDAALKKAESVGGKRWMGPEGTLGILVVGQFTDPEGNLIGVAGTE